MRPALFQSISLSSGPRVVEVFHHIFFGEHHHPRICATLQYASTQQWQFLKRDSVSVNQVEIDANDKLFPAAILVDRIEVIVSDVFELLKARKGEKHDSSTRS